MRFNLWLGRRMGTVVCLLSGKRKNVAYANLKAAFCKEKTPRQIKRIMKDAYKNMAQIFVELISMTKMDKRYIDKHVLVRNIERIEKASKNPKGMILLSAHFGNWELSTATSAVKGFQLHVLTRDQKMKRLNELLNRLRELNGNIVVRKGSDIKNLFKILRDGNGIGLLADQNAGEAGELINLFGRPASTTSGPYRIAQKTGAWVLPAFIHRKKGGLYHELVLEPPMVIEKGEEIIPYVREYNRHLEKHIRAHPDQWLWMHKKWKLTPVKKIMVLDDGKKGHLKQSLAVTKQIRRYRKDKGYKPEHIELDIVEIRFKNKIARTVFNALTPFFTARCQGCLKCLKIALDRKSYEDVASRYADVIVSCGSALSGINKILKIENYAHNLTVLDPGVLNRGEFDLIVIPEHDLLRKRLKRKDNIIATDLAPNLIQPDELVSLKGAMEMVANDGIRAAAPCVGLLFGGDNRYFTFGEDLTRLVAKSVKEACRKMDGYSRVTTSRRTPVEAERILAETFTGDRSCARFISGRDDQDEHTVEKILAASDIVIVSGESISMVSEAVSSGKPVLVFMPDKKKPRYTKYEQFIESLHRRGYIKIIKPEEISKEAVHLIKNVAEITPLDDNKRIYEKVHRLF